ncbi:hypothetical protein SLEP1_g11569 [Rubroshorea leprosula]|nr:hypothetical protein SLEP1_g11569 [Rubroshorea leprosula]
MMLDDSLKSFLSLVVDSFVDLRLANQLLQPMFLFRR